MRDHRRRECFKKRYETWRHAAFDARFMNRKKSRRGHADAYWCPDCRAFHVGRRADHEFAPMGRHREGRDDGVMKDLSPAGAGMIAS